MPNGMYGGVRGRKTKVGRKLLLFSSYSILADKSYTLIEKKTIFKLKEYYICQSAPWRRFNGPMELLKRAHGAKLVRIYILNIV